MGVNLHAHRSNLRTRVLAGCVATGSSATLSPAATTTTTTPLVSHTFGFESSPGATPLHDLVGWHGVAAVPMLIKAGAEVDARDDAGTTPLMIAAGEAPGWKSQSQSQSQSQSRLR